MFHREILREFVVMQFKTVQDQAYWVVVELIEEFMKLQDLN
jgi:hypothetical protein